MLRWFCFQPHPFSPSNSDSLGIHPSPSTAREIPRRTSLLSALPLCAAAGVPCRAGHGVYTVVFCWRTGHSCKASFHPVAFDTYFFLVWLLTKESIILWTIQNFSSRKINKNITTKGKRKKISVSLSLCSFPEAVTVTEAQRHALFTKLDVSEKYIFFQIVLQGIFFFPERK